MSFHRVMCPLAEILLRLGLPAWRHMWSSLQACFSGSVVEKSYLSFICVALGTWDSLRSLFLKRCFFYRFLSCNMFLKVPSIQRHNWMFFPRGFYRRETETWIIVSLKWTNYFFFLFNSSWKLYYITFLDVLTHLDNAVGKWTSKEQDKHSAHALHRLLNKHNHNHILTHSWSSYTKISLVNGKRKGFVNPKEV